MWDYSVRCLCLSVSLSYAERESLDLLIICQKRNESIIFSEVVVPFQCQKLILKGSDYFISSTVDVCQLATLLTDCEWSPKLAQSKFKFILEKFLRDWYVALHRRAAILDLWSYDVYGGLLKSRDYGYWKILPRRKKSRFLSVASVTKMSRFNMTIRVITKSQVKSGWSASYF